MSQQADSLLLGPPIFLSVEDTCGFLFFFLSFFFFFDSEVQFITPAGPRQSLLLAKDPVQHL